MTRLPIVSRSRNLSDVRRRARLACVSAISLATLGCGRTPVIPGPALFVQVVDESGAGVGRAEVELRGTNDDSEPVSEHALGDDDGVAVFEFPGAGRYELSAYTDSVCCFHEGELAVTLTGPDELVVVDTVTGPCPTQVPTWCD